MLCKKSKDNILITCWNIKRTKYHYCYFQSVILCFVYEIKGNGECYTFIDMNMTQNNYAL